jgi:hypothetical protein
MSADLDPRHDDLTARIHALGERPVDPALQSEHLTAMAGVRRGSAFRTSLAGRAKVGAGVLAGFLLGATGLTTAGAMGPLQTISAKAVEAATPLEVANHGKSAEAKAKRAAESDDTDGDEATKGPKVLADGSIGTERIWDDDCKPVEENGTVFAGNRGLYLKQIRENGTAEELQAAKDSDCGKPKASLTEDDSTADEPKAADTEDDATDEEHGKSAGASDEGKAKADEANGDHGKPEGAGKPDTTPAASLPEKADDDATSKAPEHTPGEPAEVGTDTDA